MWKRHLSELLSQRQFTRFLLARLAGTTANQMFMVAVAWHMYDITSSAWDLGLVGLYQFVPALLLTLPAGHIVDRLHRGRIFAACMLTQGMAAVLLVAATEGHFVTRELILGLSVMLGCARAFQIPTQQALGSALVPKELLQRAVAFSSSGMQVAVILGPALGGVLYTFGATWVYASCAIVFLISFGLAMAVRYQQVKYGLALSWQAVFAGVVFVWNGKVLLGAISLDLFAVLLGGATALLPIYARDILQTGPVGLGVLRAAPACGALVMSLALVRWPLHRRIGPWLLGAVAVFGLSTILFGISTNFGLSLLALVIAGAADTISVVTRLTLVQVETPDDMRGRVGAVNSIFIGASNQLGEFESGATAALLGPVGSVVAGGIGTLMIALLWLRLFPTMANRDRMI